MELKTGSIISQKIIANTAMQQAFAALQLPLSELAAWIYTQIEQNPLISYEEVSCLKTSRYQEEKRDELDFTKKEFSVLENLDDLFINSVFEEERDEEKGETAPCSLFDHLMQQVREHLPKKEWTMAEEVIGNLDERGFIGQNPISNSLLEILQTFDPPGIFGRNLVESLLLQLKRQHRQQGITYQVVEFYFADLLKGKFSFIASALGLSQKELKKHLLADFKELSFDPTSSFKPKNFLAPLIPDILVTPLDSTWDISLNTEGLPSLKLAYTSVHEGFLKEEKYFRSHLAKAKWLLHILQRREETLKKLTQFIISRQPLFFSGEVRKILPLRMQEAAQALSLNESTIARATLDKYISTPFGIFPFRYFFSKPISSSPGKPVSTHTIKEKIKQLICQEDKASPLSDEKIRETLKGENIHCSRRTIAKYRKEINILNASFRKSP